MDSLRIVGIGGGTGLPVVLRGLPAEKNVDVFAIVTVTDNDGSSGRLRENFGVPAFGDLFQHRFSTGDVDGHSPGNLIVTALYQKTGSLRRALQTCPGADGIDFCVVNSLAVEPADAVRYRNAGSPPVLADVGEIAAPGVTPVQADLFRFDDEKIRHNPSELARLIVAIAQGEAQPWRASQAA